MINPENGEIDENQNNIWNINLGLTNLGYLEYMKIMGKLLVNKKKLDKRYRKLGSKAMETSGTEGNVEPTSEMVKLKA